MCANHAVPCDAEGLRRLDISHFLHPFTDHQALSRKGLPIIIRGEGVYLWDSEGRKLLDAMSGICCVNLGYGRKELIHVAQEQVEKLAFCNNSDASVIPAIELAKLLCDVTPPGFEHFFFTNSGSEATDTAARIARRHWELLGKPEKKIVIAARGGTHGSTTFAAALGRPNRNLSVVDVDLIPNYWSLNEDLPPELFGIRAGLWLEQKILERGPDKVAAFIGEPIQAASGFVEPTSTYWPEIRRICNKYHILLISDEVICGFGRIGAWFGCEHFGFNPDLMTFAKGVTSGYIPLGGVAVGRPVAEVLIERGGIFDHGFTSSGHPVACAVAIANIRALQRERLVEIVAEKSGPCLKQRLLELVDHPLVESAENCGMLGALRLVKQKDNLRDFDSAEQLASVCRESCFDAGVIVRTIGRRLLIAPPLVIRHDQIREMVELIKIGLNRAYQVL
jgi:putrescine aminotransferase